MVVPPWLATATLCGVAVTEHWRRLGQEAGVAVTVAARGDGLDGRCLDTDAPTLGAGEVAGEAVTSLADLDRVEERWRQRLVERWRTAGVRFHRPQTTTLDATVLLEAGCVIGSGVTLLGDTRLGARVQVRAGCWLHDTHVGDDAQLLPHSVCSGARIGPETSVGPMAHLRPGAVLERAAKAGNFVEMKKAVLREGAKASHLTYLGDAEIGPRANVGAGTITCNYDGWGKHRTEIGAGAFIGSNTALVAPVRVGAGAIVGAGSTVTADVPDDALMLCRARPRVLEGRAPLVHRRNRRRARGLDESDP